MVRNNRDFVCESCASRGEIVKLGRVKVPSPLLNLPNPVFVVPDQWEDDVRSFVNANFDEQRSIEETTEHLIDRLRSWLRPPKPPVRMGKRLSLDIPPTSILRIHRNQDGVDIQCPKCGEWQEFVGLVRVVLTHMR
jgi:hypothetical protein